jgi:hypothetical protein
MHYRQSNTLVHIDLYDDCQSDTEQNMVLYHDLLEHRFKIIPIWFDHIAFI